MGEGGVEVEGKQAGIEIPRDFDRCHQSVSPVECMRKHRDAVFSVMSPQKEERTSSQPDGLSGASPLNLGNHIVARRAVEVLAILS